MSSLSTTCRMVSIYAEADDDLVQQEHDHAMACLDLEEIVACGLMTYELLCDVEARFQAAAFQDKIGPKDEVWSKLRELYRKWHQRSEKVLEAATTFQKQGFNVEKLSEFQDAIDEIQCRMELWDIEPRVMTFEEAVRAVKPDNPRPGRYDD